MKLKQTAAVVSAVVLVGGYIALRGGGILLPGSKSARVWRETDEEPTTAPAPTPAEPRLFPGSKSGRVVEDNVLYGTGTFPSTSPSTSPASQPSTKWRSS